MHSRSASRPASVPVSSAVTILLGAAGLAASGAVLLGGAAPALLLPRLFPSDLGGGFVLDPLAAVFLAAISLLAVAAALYAPSYLAPHGEGVNLSAVAWGLPLFVVTMAAAVAAADLLTFLLAYEAMSVVSYLLVLAEHRRPAARRAAGTYLVVTQAGTALAVLALLFVAAPGGGFGWEALAQGARTIPDSTRSILFVLLLAGFGTKAGLVPLHVWLPLAHPQAPSHISALMSGVMVKVALLGLLRGILLLGPGPAWWGMLLLAAGGVSAFLGVLYALGERDLKRILAFSTVENVGIIAMGLGLFVLGRSRGEASLAGLGLAAALLHTLNHSAYKGLLFLGAGAVQHAAGTRDLESLGGLFRRMPATGGMLLLGSLALAGLPPLNGFASELLTFHALLEAAQHAAAAERGMLLLAVAALAGTAGLAVACFVRAFGIAFLGVARSESARAAQEVPFGMRAGMFLLAGSSLLLGLVPGAALSFLDPSVAAAGVGAFPVRSLTWGGILTHWGPYAPLPLFVLLAAIAAAAAGVSYFLGGAVRRHGTWNCGGEHTPRMAYSAAGFAKPIRVIFRRILLQRAETEAAYVESKRFRRVLRYDEESLPFWTSALYLPLRGAFLAVARRARRLQAGPVNLYLGYLFAAVLVLLAVIW